MRREPGTGLLVYEKLVRDGVVDELNSGTKKFSIRQCKDEKEFREMLGKKVLEELQELFAAESKEEKIEEMGDIISILNTLCELNGFDLKAAGEASVEKDSKRGAFKGKNILEWVSER